MNEDQMTAMRLNGSGTTATRISLLILGAYNVVQNSLLNEKGYVPGNVVVSAALLGLGRSTGATWEEMGLQAGDIRRGLGIGLTTTAVGGALVAVAPRPRRIRRLLDDQRANTGSRADIAKRALVRFPLGTALFEETAFRGVLPALFEKAGVHRPDAESAVVFGLWHLIPTHYALRVNRVGRNSGSRLALTILGSAAAGAAGYALSRLRRQSGSLLAPWLIHSVVNSSTYLASVMVRNR